MGLRQYAANVRWGQVLFGAAFGIVGWDTALRVAAGVLDGGTILRLFGLVLILLAFWVYLGNMYRFGLLPDYGQACPNCNGPVNRYSEFCEHCGADLVAEENLVSCPECGAGLYPDTAFCPECGAKQAPSSAG